MKQYMMLMFGFERPTPEIMHAWTAWFESMGDRLVAQGHFPRGYEYSAEGGNDLPMAADSITGYVTVRAADFDAARMMAASNPFITAIRVYEIAGN